MEADPRNIFAEGLFEGKVALVTGGGRGIGAAVALGFAERGADIVIASRTGADLRHTAARIEEFGVQCLAMETNIRDTASVDALQQAVMERFGRVDFLINNAGGQFMAHPFAISDNGWRSVIDLNLNGTWNVIGRFVRAMMQAGSGSIVNVVHAFAFERGAPMFAHSGAARAGVINLTRSLAPYLEGRNVTINAIAPGVTISDAAAANYGLSAEDWRARLTRTRAADPADIAAIIMFLCSPAARMINGAVVNADAAASQHNFPPHTSEALFDAVEAMFAPLLNR
jgi:NAD(P)-dependent dehydrogenase (short-subunit alcohol dehydrogenase family)